MLQSATLHTRCCWERAQGMSGTCMHMLRANTAAALTSGWMACSSRLSSSNASPSICAHHSIFTCIHVSESLFVSSERSLPPQAGQMRSTAAPSMTVCLCSWSVFIGGIEAWRRTCTLAAPANVNSHVKSALFCASDVLSQETHRLLHDVMPHSASQRDESVPEGLMRRGACL